MKGTLKNTTLFEDIWSVHLEWAMSRKNSCKKKWLQHQTLFTHSSTIESKPSLRYYLSSCVCKIGETWRNTDAITIGHNTTPDHKTTEGSVSTQNSSCLALRTSHEYKQPEQTVTLKRQVVLSRSACRAHSFKVNHPYCAMGHTHIHPDPKVGPAANASLVGLCNELGSREEQHEERKK